MSRPRNPPAQLKGNQKISLRPSLRSSAEGRAAAAGTSLSAVIEARMDAYGRELPPDAPTVSSWGVVRQVLLETGAAPSRDDMALAQLVVSDALRALGVRDEEDLPPAPKVKGETREKITVAVRESVRVRAVARAETQGNRILSAVIEARMDAYARPVPDGAPAANPREVVLQEMVLQALLKAPGASAKNIDLAEELVSDALRVMGIRPDTT